MAWNQPGNNGQDRDPWGSSNLAATLGEWNKVAAIRDLPIWMISSVS